MSSKIFDDLFLRINTQLLEEVIQFIRSVLASSNDDFPNIAHSYINVTSLVLGAQSSDHGAILDLIANNIKEKYKLFGLARITPDIDRKTRIISKLDQYEDKDQLLVIVEQTEQMEVHALGDLITYLLSRMDKCRRKQPFASTMIIFTKNSTRFPIQRMFGQHITTRLRFLPTIIKDSAIWIDVLQEQLISMTGVSMSLAPSVVQYITERFRFRYASLEDARLIYNTALHLHYMNPFASLPNITEKELGELREDDPDLFEHVAETFKLNLVNAKAVRNIVGFYENLRFKINNSHMQTFFELIRDSRDDFPGSVLDLYQQLEKHHDLGQSESVINAISRIRSFTRDRLLERFELSIGAMNKSKNAKKTDIFKDLSSFRDKIVNNDTLGDSKTSLINLLMKYAAGIKSPYKIDFGDGLFFRDLVSLRCRVDQLPRGLTRDTQRLPEHSKYLSILIDIFNSSSEESSLADYFDEFIHKVDLLKEQPEKKTRKKAKTLDENFFRLLFIAMIGDLEQHDMLKRNARAQKGRIQKCIWL